MKRLSKALAIVIMSVIVSCSSDNKEKEILQERLSGYWGLPGGEGNFGCAKFDGNSFFRHYFYGSHGSDSYTIRQVNCSVEYLSGDQIRFYDCDTENHPDPYKVTFRETSNYEYVDIDRNYHRSKMWKKNQTCAGH